MLRGGREYVQCCGNTDWIEMKIKARPKTAIVIKNPRTCGHGVSASGFGVQQLHIAHEQ